jgi:signal transduction histidine kinase
VIAHEADLARSNRLLLGEVATSLDQLQAHARDLEESRQRLVAAQDQERRRIERDLHDGAQHELVALASRLHQLSVDGSAGPDQLASLARQAERAVFALQDLARGIYPSVLTDHGVAAAIRSHARRMPVDISLVIDPQTAGLRWSPELETALYFVAVEAIGNSCKHSGSQALNVTLTKRGPDVVLEVHDDGVGFNPAGVVRRSGLQHMADRMAALGGSLVVRSRPDEGTWVTAEASTVTGRSSGPAGRAAPPAPGG